MRDKVEGKLASVQRHGAMCFSVHRDAPLKDSAHRIRMRQRHVPTDSSRGKIPPWCLVADEHRASGEQRLEDHETEVFVRRGKEEETVAGENCIYSRSSYWPQILSSYI